MRCGHRYGVPRELGAVIIRGNLIRVIIPRVHADRTVAQFCVQAAPTHTQPGYALGGVTRA